MIRHFIRKNILRVSITLFFLGVLFFAALSFIRGSGNEWRNIVINEICSSNLSCYYDENGLHPDWAELYNKGSKDIDISGWMLSDSENKRSKWSFPKGTVIPANGYLLVFLDGRGKAVSDADNGLHAPFGISDGNENLYLSTDRLQPVDLVEVPALKYDTVWGRTEDGKNSFSRLTPTPLESNASASPVIYPSLRMPVFSAESGFYDEEFDLTLSSAEGEIHYTLDGSTPGPDSPLYEKPIRIYDRSSEENIWSSLPEVSVDLMEYMHKHFRIPDQRVDKCTVVRAAVFDKKGNMSETATRSYFIGFNEKPGYDGIGVISLVSDPEGLFGYEDGIYVIGKCGEEHFMKKVAASENALKFLEENPDTPTDGSVSINGIKLSEYTDSNYMQKGSGWEREASITVFDKDHFPESAQGIGIRVKGHRTRNFPKKSFNIHARDIYDGRYLKEFSFGNKERSVSLFTGGNDCISMIRDVLIKDILADLNFGNLNFTEPYYLFLDGEFWGLYRFSERMDAEYLHKLYDVKEDEVVIIKDRLVSEGMPSDQELYTAFREYAGNAPFDDPDEYREFMNEADIDSFIDYFAARIYLEEGIDWPNTNVALWRTRNKDKSNEYADGRWRWFNFDNNINIHYDSVSTNTMSVVLNGNRNFKRNEIFCHLMLNSDFRKRFRDRFNEISEKTFEPESCIALLDKYAAEIRPYVEADYRRYYGDNYSVEDFDKDIEEMKKFFRERASYIVPYVNEACY